MIQSTDSLGTGLPIPISPDIALLSPQSRGTGKYGSATDVPLKPSFFLSASVTCLIVRDRRDKRLRSFSCFSQLVRSTFSFVVLFFSFSVKLPNSTLPGTNLLTIKILKSKTSRSFRPSFLSLIRL